MTNVGIITQARMSSTRLPGKVLTAVNGKTILEYHLERLRAADTLLIVATTDNASDDAIADLAKTLGYPVFRGSEQNVLSRFAGAARAHALDVVVRVTSDCPFIDGTLVKRGIETFLALGDERAYLSNTLHRTYPRGLDFEVFSSRALYEAETHASSETEREHVTPYLYDKTKSKSKSRILQITRDNDASAHRVTLDTPEDLELITRLVEDHGANQLDSEQLIDLLEAHPELVRINAQVEQKKLGR